MILQVIITVMLIRECEALLVNSDVSSVLTCDQTSDLHYNEECWTQIPVSRTHTAVSASLSRAADHSAVTPGRCAHSTVSTPSSAMILSTTNTCELLQVKLKSAIFPVAIQPFIREDFTVIWNLHTTSMPTYADSVSSIKVRQPFHTISQSIDQPISNFYSGLSSCCHR